jgi:hypothetical protein
MNRHPFLGDHARGEPQPEPEKVRGDRVQFQRPMSLSAVQKNSDGRNGDMRGDERK